MQRKSSPSAKDLVKAGKRTVHRGDPLSRDARTAFDAKLASPTHELMTTEKRTAHRGDPPIHEMRAEGLPTLKAPVIPIADLGNAKIYPSIAE